MSAKNPKYELMIALGLIILTLFTSLFYSLKWETLGYGEVENLQAVNEYLKGNFVKNFYIFDTPPFERYLLSLSVIFFNDVEVGLRAISVIFGVLSVLLVFLVCKRFYKSNTVPLLASTILLSSIIHIQLSRYAQYETTLAFFFLLTIYLLFNYIQNKNKKSALLLGIVVGISLSIKFVMVIPILIIVIYAIIKGNIRVKIKPSFTLSIDNGLIKALIITIIIFFLVWPFSFYTLKTDISVIIEGDRGVNTTQNIPIFLLSVGKRISNTLVNDSTILQTPYNIPVVGYLFSFLVKENPVIVIMFFIGLYSLYKFRQPADKLLVLSLILFLILISLQKSTFGYRQMEIIMPLIAIIAAKSLDIIKTTQRNKLFVAGLLAAVLVSYAFLAGPNYALHYNTLDSIIESPRTEGYYSEGMIDTISFIKTNCNKTLSDPFYNFMIEPYYQNLTTIKEGNYTGISCVISGTFGKDMENIEQFISNNNCILSKKIIKNNIELINIFNCS